MADQHRKPTYEMYPIMLERQLVRLRQLMPKSTQKKLDRQGVLELAFKNNREAMTGLLFRIMAEEFYWQRFENQVIFPESTVVLDNLLKARFTMESGAGFSLPYEAFVLAMPHGYRFADTRIPSLLVTWHHANETLSEVILPFCRYIKAPLPSLTQDISMVGRHLLTIVYADPFERGIYRRTVITEDDLPDLLSASDEHAFERTSRNRKLVSDAEPMTAYGLKIQFHAMKLIAALGVYHLATEGKRLSSGYPSQITPRLDGKLPEQKVTPATIASFVPRQAHAEHESHEGHYRTWFFRQLRADRYYQGEYESYPRGSRYTFVSDTVVGLTVSPNTQG